MHTMYRTLKKMMVIVTSRFPWLRVLISDDLGERIVRMEETGIGKSGKKVLKKMI